MIYFVDSFALINLGKIGDGKNLLFKMKMKMNKYLNAFVCTSSSDYINIDGQNGCAALNTDSDGDVSIGGTGGNSVLGLGGQSSSRTTGDRSATGYGAGGGGGSRYSGYITGGVGGGGVVIVTEYYV